MVSCRPPALYLVAVCYHSFVAVAQLLFVRSSVVSCRPPALYLVAVCYHSFVAVAQLLFSPSKFFRIEHASHLLRV